MSIACSLPHVCPPQPRDYLTASSPSSRLLHYAAQEKPNFLIPPKKEDERERPAFLHSLLSPLSRERSSATTRYRVRCGVLLEGREGDYASGIQKCEEEERQARPLQKSISLEFAYMGCVRTVPEEKSFSFLKTFTELSARPGRF